MGSSLQGNRPEDAVIPGDALQLDHLGADHQLSGLQVVHCSEDLVGSAAR